MDNQKPQKKQGKKKVKEKETHSKKCHARQTGKSKNASHPICWRQIFTSCGIFSVLFHTNQDMMLSKCVVRGNKSVNG